MLVVKRDKTLTDYETIGRALGVTGTRIRQIEKKALVKMQSYLVFHGLTLSDILPLQSVSEIPRDVLDALPKIHEEKQREEQEKIV